MSAPTYKIPDDYLRSGMRCIRVYVPDLDEYEADFWGAYETFGAWSLWERDTLKRGRLVAALWRQAIDRARYEHLLYGGCPVNITNLRQNPINKCQLQYSLDNGASWVTYADISECASGISIAGADGVTNIHIENNVIVGEDRCGDTVPLGQVSDPSHNSSYTPPFPEGLPGGRCNAGANAAKYMEDQIYHWAAARITLTTIIEQVINIVEGLALWLPETAWTTPVWEVFQQITAWTTGNWEALQTYAMYDTLRVFFARFYDDYGVMTQTQWQTMTDEMKTHYTIPSTTDEDRAWFIATWIAGKLGSVGMTRIATSMGILDADCSDVEWSYTFDFLQGLQGWHVNKGQWIQGTGIRTLFYIVGGGVGELRWASMEYDITGIQVEGVDLHYFAELGENNFDPDARFAAVWKDSDAPGNYLTGEDRPIVAGTNVVKWRHTTESFTNLGLAVVPGHWYIGDGSDPGGLAIIQKAVIYGTGTNPFI